jgi:hypothetical protein
MLRRFGTVPAYITVIEFQKATGLAHLHILINHWIDHGWVKESWQALGGGQQVYIEHVDVHRAAKYISKYLSKALLLSTLPGMRRVTTSRTIRLDEKKRSEYQWAVVRAQIERLFTMLGEGAVDVVRSDGELDSFAVRE